MLVIKAGCRYDSLPYFFIRRRMDGDISKNIIESA